MAPSFKISFPLPRRPSASSPDSQYSTQSNIDDSPRSHPGAKAERVLGASEADAPVSKKHSKKRRKQLRKFPSFMSVTLSNVDAESSKTPDEFPFPAMHSLSDLVSQPRPDRDTQGSSPLLSEQHTLGFTDGVPCSDTSRPRARRAESPSTLRPHYDPKKSPLSISQQTSASSMRDMALRKGFPQLPNPLGLNKNEAVESIESAGLHSRNLPTGTKVSESPNLLGNSIKRIDSIPRRRPSVMDPPTLYPNTNRAVHAVSPPPALINVALPKPLSPQSQQKLSFSRWWTKVKTQIPPTPPTLVPSEYQRRHEDFDNNFSSIKLNVKKPYTQTKAGMRNWFDALEDEGILLDSDRDVEVLGTCIPRPYTPPLSAQEVMTQGARPPQIPARKSSCANTTKPPTLSDQKASFRLNSTPIRSLCSESSSQALKEMKPPARATGSPDATTTQTTTSNKGHPQEIDLQSTSFLELSSSEDEMESFSDAPCRRNRIRASIEKASYNNEVSVGNAQRAQPVRPRSIVNRRTRRLSRISSAFDKVPPVPKIPDQPRFSQKTSSVRWREIVEDKAGPTESTVDSEENPLSGSIDAGIVNTRAKQTTRRSKFIQVSSEEEKLLQAMRDKRASIRQDDFDKSFRRAMQLQEIGARPKTAAGDGRASCSPSYVSSSSTSPPSAEFAVLTSGSKFRFSASVEDLRLENAYPFADVPLDRKPPLGISSPSRTSPSLSFSPSDILPETPAGRESPITPPSGHSALSVCGRGEALSPARGITAMNKVRPESKGTVSSSEGAELQVLDVDRVPPWAMER